MKKIFTLFITAISFSSFSQIVVVGTGFDNYANDSATAPAGWYMSWHSLSPASSYTTAANAGVALTGCDPITAIVPAIKIAAAAPQTMPKVFFASIFIAFLSVADCRLVERAFYLLMCRFIHT